MGKSMFCYQCQEAAKGEGCQTTIGMCGKESSTAALQDLLIHTAKGVALYSSILRKANKGKDLIKNKINRYLVNALFVTITNANFDDDAIIKEIKIGLNLREELKKLCSEEEMKNAKIFGDEFISWYLEDEKDILEYSYKKEIGVLRTDDDDVRSLRELLIYGLKGMAAYAEHAMNLGKTQISIFEFVEKALIASMDDTLSAKELIDLVMECGNYGVQVMALLDEAHNMTFGSPEITKIKIGTGDRPGILISGHDLNDLRQLLEQSENSGVDIYTHSEMLPGHFYPELKKYKHFYGNYGSAWWNQRKEFETFNGPIVFTTNCIVPPTPKASYKDRVFTTNASGFPGWKKIERNKNNEKDFSEVIELAKKCKAPTEIESGEIIGGFGHNQVLSLADTIVENIKNGDIRKFVVMSGCDGRMADRKYYTEFAEKLPKDTIILTSGCAKFRYNKLNLGDINGIPRVLDAGQCNDSYTWAVVALKLKEVFGLNDINELPIAFNIAWYEQKAVIVLLALLYLGVKNIHVGPTLPAFLSPNVAKVLIETFGLAGMTTVEEDLAKFGLLDNGVINVEANASNNLELNA